MISKCPFSFNAVTSYPDAAKATTTTNGKDGSRSTSPVTVITNLANPRSSDGMGLPTELSTATIDMIVATAPAVAPKMLDITKCFYSKVLSKHPALLQWFNPAVRIYNDNEDKLAI
jgi:hypothetical protein